MILEVDGIPIEDDKKDCYKHILDTFTWLYSFEETQ